jgi:hypothetical protein
MSHRAERLSELQERSNIQQAALSADPESDDNSVLSESDSLLVKPRTVTLASGRHFLIVETRPNQVSEE